jgi:hypothetical protein
LKAVSGRKPFSKNLKANKVAAAITSKAFKGLFKGSFNSFGNLCNG